LLVCPIKPANWTPLISRTVAPYCIRSKVATHPYRTMVFCFLQSPNSELAPKKTYERPRLKT
jgi:hypothetical protein